MNQTLHQDTGPPAVILRALIFPQRCSRIGTLSFRQPLAKVCPARVIRQAVSVLGHREVFVRLLETTGGNLNRYYRRKALSPVQSEALLDMLYVFARAITIFGDIDSAREWLETALPALGGHNPLGNVRHLCWSRAGAGCAEQDRVRRILLMRLYRICPENLLENYSGRGASYQDGGRWNRAGLPVLYFACSASVAMLEMANYLRSPGLVPKSYRLGIFETGDIGFEQWGIEDLPTRWNDYPYPAATQELGSRWLQATNLGAAACAERRDTGLDWRILPWSIPYIPMRGS